MLNDKLTDRKYKNFRIDHNTVLYNNNSIPLYNNIETDPFGEKKIDLIIPFKKYLAAGLIQRRMAVHKFIQYCENNIYHLTEDDIRIDERNLQSNKHKFIFGRTIINGRNEAALNDTLSRMKSTLFIYRGANYLLSPVCSESVSRVNVMATNMFLSTPVLWRDVFNRLRIRSVNDHEPMFGAIRLVSSMFNVEYSGDDSLVEQYKTKRISAQPIDVFQQIKRKESEIIDAVSKTDKNGLILMPTYIDFKKFQHLYKQTSMLCLMGLRAICFSKLH